MSIKMLITNKKCKMAGELLTRLDKMTDELVIISHPAFNEYMTTSDSLIKPHQFLHC